MILTLNCATNAGKLLIPDQASLKQLLLNNENYYFFDFYCLDAGPFVKFWAKDHAEAKRRIA